MADSARFLSPDRQKSFTLCIHMGRVLLQFFHEKPDSVGFFETIAKYLLYILIPQIQHILPAYALVALIALTKGEHDLCRSMFRHRVNGI